ncbi:MAG: tetratricopeptide repeat protein, partial [Acidimicrobiales bacterium]
TWALGVGLGELGRLYQTLGRLDEAEACFLESIDLFGNADYHGSHYLYTELGRLATARGDHELARRYHLESVAIAEANGNRGCMAESLAGMGHAAEARNEPEVALDFYRRATALGEQRSLVERGHDEWRVAVERLSELVDQANR